MSYHGPRHLLGAAVSTLLAIATLAGCAQIEPGRGSLASAPSTSMSPQGTTATATTSPRTTTTPPTPTVDVVAVQAAYEAGVRQACNIALDAPLTESVAEAVASAAGSYDSAWSVYRGRARFMEEVTTCSAQPRRDRIASECSGPPQVELLNRNPDSAAGECVTLVLEIIQFDQGTGACVFRARFDVQEHEYSFDYPGENALISFTSPCPQLDSVGVDDVLRMRVYINGGLTYDTTSGGTATAVDLSAVGDQVVTVLQDN